MNTVNRPTISAVVLTHNNEGTISTCLSSVERQSACREIIVVDNESSDSTLEIVRRKHPGVRIIETGGNLGYASGNNSGIRASSADIFIVVNPDAVLLDHAIVNLVEPVIQTPNLLTTPLILLPDGKTVNACGLYCTPTGMSFPRGLGLSLEELMNLPPANGLSGCCFAGMREVFLNLGGLDESFFMYNEDSEISWRAHLKGVRIVTVPSSVVIHYYRERISLFKLHQLERNRYLLLRMHAPLRWILLYMPSLLATELLSVLAYSRFGFAGLEKKKDAWMEAMNRRYRTSEGDHSSLRQALVPVFPAEPRITATHAEPILRKVLAWLFRANWWMVR